MPWQERHSILSNLRCVDQVIEFDDSDMTARNAIAQVRLLYPDDQIVFANGGDRNGSNIPELDSNDLNLEFVFGVGGNEKLNSSSWILQEWRAPATPRPWGYYRVLHEVGSRVKLKELTVNPGKYLSMQRHQDRSEHWFVAEGTATVYTVNPRSTDCELQGVYQEFDHIHIPVTQWHQLANENTVPLKIIEIQYGSNCVEEDIERA